MLDSGNHNKVIIHPVAKVIIPPRTKIRSFLVRLSKIKPPRNTDNIEPNGNTDEEIPACPGERLNTSFRYKGKKLWKAIRIVKDIMLMQINQNLELLMKLISASDREALSRW